MIFNFFSPEILSKLIAAARQQLGDDHKCTAALIEAEHDPSPGNIALAQEEIAQLKEEERDQLLMKTHIAMATDPEAILKQWQTTGRAN